jgi:primase-polymerase (primpol)-like protein
MRHGSSPPDDLLDYADWLAWRADQAGIESITSKYIQRDGAYITWTVKRHGYNPITRKTLRDALQAIRDGKRY